MRYEVLTRKAIDRSLSDLKVALTNIQFGILFELDFQEKLREKNIAFEIPYKILEVCNPLIANEALKFDLNVGYFLPCKIILYEKDGTTHMGLIKPTELLVSFENLKLLELAQKIEDKLIDALKIAAEV